MLGGWSLTNGQFDKLVGLLFAIFSVWIIGALFVFCLEFLDQHFEGLLECRWCLPIPTCACWGILGPNNN